MNRVNRYTAMALCCLWPAFVMATSKVPAPPAAQTKASPSPSSRQLTGLAAELAAQFPSLANRITPSDSFKIASLSVGASQISGLEALPVPVAETSAYPSRGRGLPRPLPAGPRRPGPPHFRVLYPCTYGDVIAAEASGVRVALRAVASTNAPAEEEAGTLAYRDAFPYTDSLQVFKGGRSEEFLRLRSRQAPTRFEYEITAVEGVEQMTLHAGAVRFEDARGRGVEISAPWVVDARGRRSIAAAHWVLGPQAVHQGPSRTLTLVFDPQGLAYPLVIDPGFTTVGSMTTPRDSHTATLLLDGRVLVTGGFDGEGPTADCEVYDPSTGNWSNSGIAPLSYSRLSHTATLLPSGKVLVTGGFDGTNYLDKVELFDPATGTWTTKAPMNIPRAFHAATLLPNGKVLVTGGQIAPTDWTSSIETFDPSSETWTVGTSHPMASKRAGHIAVLLQDGSVLVAGGTPDGTTPLDTAETYTELGGWTATTETLTVARFFHSATVLPSGKVLVAGGSSNGATPLADSEIYDPSGGTWTATAGSLYDAPAVAHGVAHARWTCSGCGWVE